MGDKIESKKLAQAAGVNVVPGFLGDIATTDDAVRIAGEIGYPVMMKASAGGGGKGMRLAWSEEDVRDGFEATKREGLASFGDDRVFIEKFIEQPRHIEIQLLGDQHGNIVYLGERECSIQRRHQKVVEEAPSPFVTPGMRKAMGEQAVALARAVGYYSAGTVELIVAGNDPTGESFYFLEMNTRLQVEHPVTEEVTGLDLVEQMIRVAAGEKLAFSQADVRLDGWAVETRVYAEDPYRGFLPSTGRLVRYRPPSPSRMAGAGQEPRIRVDDGVVEGGEVSMFYDPMIAKLVTWGPDRLSAIDAQAAALDAFEIEGIGHNVDFLSAVMQHPRFRSGAITTGFIAEEFAEGFSGAPADPELVADLAALAGLVATMQDARAAEVDGQLGNPEPSLDGQWVVMIGGEQHRVTLAPFEGGVLAGVDGGDPQEIVGKWSPGQRLLTASVGGRVRTVQVRRDGRGWLLTTRGAAHKVQVLPPHVADLSRHMIAKVPSDLSRLLLAPMPGLLTRIDVTIGDRVEAGQAVAVMEAMKMENILRAGRSATVKAVPARVGESLSVDQLIVEFE
jgi:propionyl-CoA carboxylase alpha chain